MDIETRRKIVLELKYAMNLFLSTIALIVMFVFVSMILMFVIGFSKTVSITLASLCMTPTLILVHIKFLSKRDIKRRLTIKQYD